MVTIALQVRTPCARAMKVGRVDYAYGKSITDNPFMCPENRQDWKQGYQYAKYMVERNNIS